MVELFLVCTDWKSQSNLVLPAFLASRSLGLLSEWYLLYGGSWTSTYIHILCIMVPLKLLFFQSYSVCLHSFFPAGSWICKCLEGVNVRNGKPQDLASWNGEIVRGRCHALLHCRPKRRKKRPCKQGNVTLLFLQEEDRLSSCPSNSPANEEQSQRSNEKPLFFELPVYCSSRPFV